MRLYCLSALLLISELCHAQNDKNLAPIPDPPELPPPDENLETLEPDITIIRKGKKTIQEYRVNGELYMVKIIPDIGPAYYLVDGDGDGNLNVRRSDLEKDIKVPQWVIFNW